jgi:hypothetical protein
MRASIGILILITVATGAFAEDKNQVNVYDELRQWMKPLPNATVDEEIPPKADIAERYSADIQAAFRYYCWWATSHP